MSKANGRKVAVVAVGGNSLIVDKENRTVPDQYAAAVESMTDIAGMIEAVLFSLSMISELPPTATTATFLPFALLIQMSPINAW